MQAPVYESGKTRNRWRRFIREQPDVGSMNEVQIPLAMNPTSSYSEEDGETHMGLKHTYAEILRTSNK